MIQSQPIPVYAGRDNAISWAIASKNKIESPRGITRCLFICKKDDQSDVIIDSDAVPSGFTFSGSKLVNGATTYLMKWNPGIACDGAFPEGGMWKCDVYLYDAIHINGVYHGQFTLDVKSLASPPSTVNTLAINVQSSGFLQSTVDSSSYSEFTLTMWIYVDSTVVSGFPDGTYGIFDDDGTKCYVSWQKGTTNGLIVHTEAASGGSQSLPSSLLTFDEWHFLGIRYSVSNGVADFFMAKLGDLSITSYPFSGTIAASPSLHQIYFGVDGLEGGYWWLGYMEQGRIWTRYLSDAELLTEMGSHTVVSTDSLWASYPMQGATDNSDESGNGRTGTFTNFGMLTVDGLSGQT